MIMMNEDWPAMFESMNEQVVTGLERTVDAQTAFVDAWQQALEDAVDEDLVESGAEGVTQALEVWIDASSDMVETASRMAEGESIDPREFRDIWLQAANESSKAVMDTEAFAELTGEGVSESLEMQQEFDDMWRESLESMGMATVDHVEEVGERLVELERRQHEIDRKLDRLLDELEEQ